MSSLKEYCADAKGICTVPFTSEKVEDNVESSPFLKALIEESKGMRVRPIDYISGRLQHIAIEEKELHLALTLARRGLIYCTDTKALNESAFMRRFIFSYHGATVCGDNKADVLNMLCLLAKNTPNYDDGYGMGNFPTVKPMQTHNIDDIVRLWEGGATHLSTCHRKNDDHITAVCPTATFTPEGLEVDGNFLTDIIKSASTDNGTIFYHKGMLYTGLMGSEILIPKEIDEYGNDSRRKLAMRFLSCVKKIEEPIRILIMKLGCKMGLIAPANYISLACVPDIPLSEEQSPLQQVLEMLLQ